MAKKKPKPMRQQSLDLGGSTAGKSPRRDTDVHPGAKHIVPFDDDVAKVNPYA